MAEFWTFGLSVCLPGGKEKTSTNNQHYKTSRSNFKTYLTQTRVATHRLKTCTYLERRISWICTRPTNLEAGLGFKPSLKTSVYMTLGLWWSFFLSLNGLQVLYNPPRSEIDFQPRPWKCTNNTRRKRARESIYLSINYYYCNYYHRYCLTRRRMTGNFACVSSQRRYYTYYYYFVDNDRY